MLVQMSDYGRSASRGAQAGTPSAPRRTRLGKQHWQDIRQARKLGADGELHSMELHGVRLTFCRSTVRTLECSSPTGGGRWGTPPSGLTSLTVTSLPPSRAVHGGVGGWTSRHAATVKPHPPPL